MHARPGIERRRESMDDATRKTWSRPEPIVLVRSGPEETVLTTCKKASSDQDSAAGYGGCAVPGSGDCGVCAACVVLAPILFT